MRNIGFTQVSEIVQQTWYLSNIHLDNTTYYVPYNQDIQLNFDGNDPNYITNTNGIENTFAAHTTFNNNNLALSEVQVSSTTCTSSYCEFEDLYFYEFLSNQTLDNKTFSYWYYVFSSGRKRLRLTDDNGNIAEFTDQPLPDIDTTLFKTWYLHYMSYDLGGGDIISDYDPPIAPTLTINPDMSFTGFGSCNEFSGSFDYTEFLNNGLVLMPKDFQATNDSCEFHNDFEDYYFSQFEYNYPIYFEVGEIPNTGESYFSFEVMAGFFFEFASYPVLSTPNIEKSTFSIYPNPVNDILFLKSTENSFSVSITGINGRIVISEKSNNSNIIDVSELNPGMYFIRIESSSGNITKKFIKN